MNRNHTGWVALTGAIGIERRRMLGGVAAALTSGLLLARPALAAKKRDHRNADLDSPPDDVVLCPRGQRRCPGLPGICINLNTNPNHCGACGNVCNPSEVCRGGDCVCADDHPRCGDICCLPGTECVNGSCRLAL
jgi:hypothetical protein